MAGKPQYGCRVCAVLSRDRFLTTIKQSLSSAVHRSINLNLVDPLTKHVAALALAVSTSEATGLRSGLIDRRLREDSAMHSQETVSKLADSNCKQSGDS